MRAGSAAVRAGHFAASFPPRFERCASHPLLLRKGFRGWNELVTLSFTESPWIAGGSLLQGGSTGTQAATAATGREGPAAPWVSAWVCLLIQGPEAETFHLPAALLWFKGRIWGCPMPRSAAGPPSVGTGGCCTGATFPECAVSTLCKTRPSCLSRGNAESLGCFYGEQELMAYEIVAAGRAQAHI